MKSPIAPPYYLREAHPVKKFKLEPQANGDLVVTLGPAIEHDLIRWILGEGGKISVIEPMELRKKVAEAGRRIAKNNECESL